LTWSDRSAHSVRIPIAVRTVIQDFVADTSWVWWLSSSVYILLLYESWGNVENVFVCFYHK
jgi:hypothetical protein